MNTCVRGMIILVRDRPDKNVLSGRKISEASQGAAKGTGELTVIIGGRSDDDPKEC